MSRSAVLVAFAVAAAGLSGCASPARVIEHDAAKVVVAVPDNTNAWPFYYQDAAKEAAAFYLPEPVETTVRRVKVGEQTTTAADSTRKERSFSDVISSTSITSVSDKYEYHIEYRANSRFPSPPPPGGPAAGLSPHGPGNPADRDKPATILPVTAPLSPATNLRTTDLPGPGR